MTGGEAIPARLLGDEIARLSREGVDWRGTVFAKHVFELERDLRPTPDGLSRAYIELAALLLARQARERPGPAGGLIVLADALLQDEIARALLTERALAEAAA